MLVPKVITRLFTLEYLDDSEKNITIELDGLNEPHIYAMWKINVPSKFSGQSMLYWVLQGAMFSSIIRDSGADFVQTGFFLSTSSSFALAGNIYELIGSTGTYTHKTSGTADAIQLEQADGLYLGVIGFVSLAGTTGRAKNIDLWCNLLLPNGCSVSRIL